MAQEGPMKAPGELHEGPRERSSSDIVPNLAQRNIWEPPGTLPDTSGERFRNSFCPTNGPPEAKIVDKTMLFQWGERGYCATLLASCCAATRALRRNAADEARTKETLSCARQALDLESTMPDTRLQAARAHQALQSASKNKKKSEKPPTRPQKIDAAASSSDDTPLPHVR